MGVKGEQIYSWILVMLICLFALLSITGILSHPKAYEEGTLPIKEIPAGTLIEIDDIPVLPNQFHKAKVETNIMIYIVNGIPKGVPGTTIYLQEDPRGKRLRIENYSYFIVRTEEK